MQNYTALLRATCAGISILIITGCVSGTMEWNLNPAEVAAPSDDGLAEGDGEDDPTALVSDAAPFPADMGFSSPTSSGQDADGVTPAEQAQLDELERLLNPTTISDCEYSFQLDVNMQRASCFGQTITYANHPDFVAGGQQGGFAPGASGQLPGGDMGLIRPDQADSGEACATAQNNSVTDSIDQQMASAMTAIAGLYCIARMDGLTLPEAQGESLDMTENTASAYDEIGIDFDVTMAVIEREPDIDLGISQTLIERSVVDLGSFPVFTTVLAGSMTDGTGTRRDVFMRLRYVPMSADNTLNGGKLSLTVTRNSVDKPGNCGMGTLSGSTQAVSVAFENHEDGRTTDMRSAEFCGSSGVQPFVSADNFTVDATKKFNVGNIPGMPLLATGWANNFYIAQYEAESGHSGQFRTAWQAGMFDNNMRILNLNIEGDAGKSYFGYGPDAELFAADTPPELRPDRMICNWAGPGNNHTGTPSVQQQTFSFDSTGGRFVPATSNITYAPTNSCNSAGAPFTFSSQDLSINNTGTPLTHNLVPVSTIDMDAFVPPLEVDE